MTLDLKNNYSDIKDTWTWLRNEIFIQSIFKDRYAIGGGISHDYYKSKNHLLDKKNYINPYVFIKSDTQDDVNFPTRGIFLNAEGKILDILNSNISKNDIQAKADFSFNIPISNIFTFRVNMFGGFTLGTNVDEYYKYRLGGIFKQNLNIFTSFGGFQFGELSSNQLLSSSTDFQFKIAKNLYSTATIGIYNEFDDIQFEKVLKINAYTTCITLGYKSPLGQIKANFTQQINNNKGIFSLILGQWF